MARPKKSETATPDRKVLKVYVTSEMYKAIAHKAIDSDVTPEDLARQTLEVAFLPKK